MLHRDNHILSFDLKTGIYTAPGLIDMQVNGADGVDFNDLSLDKEKVLKAGKYLAKNGVATFFPTIITNSDENIIHLFKVLSESLRTYPLLKSLIGGYHLEGPFISPRDGAKGAHDAQYIKAPDWHTFQKYQEAAEGNIKLITIAPEWEGAELFIRKCADNDVLVSMGHSLAETESIEKAVRAGMSLSTHLGNAVPLLLRRHPNMLWDQLAQDDLTAMIIADGHHVPDNFIKVVVQVKGEKVILVSDMTQFAGMPPGEYATFIGGKVVLSEDKRLTLKGGNGLLAGAAKNLLECVATVSEHGLVSLEEAWEMASTRVLKLLRGVFPEFNKEAESKVSFRLINGKISILTVIRNGTILYKNESR